MLEQPALHFEVEHETFPFFLEGQSISIYFDLTHFREVGSLAQ